MGSPQRATLVVNDESHERVSYLDGEGQVCLRLSRPTLVRSDAYYSSVAPAKKLILFNLSSRPSGVSLTLRANQFGSDSGVSRK